MLGREATERIHGSMGMVMLAQYSRRKMQYRRVLIASYTGLLIIGLLCRN